MACALLKACGGRKVKSARCRRSSIATIIREALEKFWRRRKGICGPLLVCS